MEILDSGKDKVKKICDTLMKQTLDPAKQEAKAIVDQALHEAEKIIKQAKQEAKELVEEQKIKTPSRKESFSLLPFHRRKANTRTAQTANSS